MGVLLFNLKAVSAHVVWAIMSTSPVDFTIPNAREVLENAIQFELEELFFADDDNLIDDILDAHTFVKMSLEDSGDIRCELKLDGDSSTVESKVSKCVYDYIAKSKYRKLKFVDKVHSEMKSKFSVGDYLPIEYKYFEIFVQLVIYFYDKLKGKSAEQIIDMSLYNVYDLFGKEIEAVINGKSMKFGKFFDMFCLGQLNQLKLPRALIEGIRHI